MTLNGAVSYSSQEPWIFSGSVRHNILFGMPFEADKYWQVVEACALSRDVDRWPKGDTTMVGENGLILSGKYANFRHGSDDKKSTFQEGRRPA